MIGACALGPAAVSSGDPDTLLSERFSQPGSLNTAWGIYKPAALADASIASLNGFLNVRPVQGGAGATGSLWFDDNDGILIYKLVTGNFTAILDCRSRNAAGTAAPPINAGQWRLTGLAAHDPAEAPLPVGFNYVHVAYGSVNEDLTQLVCEWKDCRASVSPYGNIAWPSGAGQLRITRTGQAFDLYTRLTPQDGWTLVRAIDRAAAPLPTTLRVGMMAYASVAGSDISAQDSQLLFSST